MRCKQVTNFSPQAWLNLFIRKAQSAITDLSDEKSRVSIFNSCKQLADQSSHSQAQSLGRVSLSYGIGFLVGPYLGGLLSKYLGYYAVAHIGALGSLLMMLATLSLLPNTREMLLKREAKDKLKGVQLRKEDKERERKGKEEENKEREKEKQKRGEMNFADILRVVERKPIRNVLILKVLAGLGFAVFHSSFSMVAQDTFKLSPEETGFTLSYSGALSIAVNTFFVGWATKLYPDGVIVKWALLLLCLCFFILSFVSSFYQLLLLMIPLSLAGTTMYVLPFPPFYLFFFVFFSFSFSFLLYHFLYLFPFSVLMPRYNRYTVVTSILTKLVEKGETGTVIGLDHATRSLSSVVAPTIGGYLFSYFGYSSLGIFSATVVGVSFVFWELLHHLY